MRSARWLCLPSLLISLLVCVCASVCGCEDERGCGPRGYFDDVMITVSHRHTRSVGVRMSVGVGVM